ncbi:MAG: ACP S-malonyltransferase [Actinobacteria bacterium]|nr:ACP S-malonyltransferase [Actinomycetota bacterium]
MEAPVTGMALLFPGQGSQHVGMGADLFERRPDLLGGEADDVLGWSLRSLCLDGPEETLTRTEHAQPALYALSYALWETLSDRLQPVGAAGHSLGEYTALAASGVVSYLEGLALVAARGRAMAAAADREPSGMAALMGADPDTAETVALARRQVGGRLQVANLNAPGQVVVAGSREDLEWLAEQGPTFGVRRVIPLNVAGGFHSSFMAPAAADLGNALAGVVFAEPRFPVWSNTTARPHDRSRLVETLVAQIVSPVLFSACLSDMAGAGVDTFIHLGPGDVTAGMARKTIPGARVLVISDLADAPPALEALGTM